MRNILKKCPTCNVRPRYIQVHELEGYVECPKCNLRTDVHTVEEYRIGCWYNTWKESAKAHWNDLVAMRGVI